MGKYSGSVSWNMDAFYKAITRMERGMELREKVLGEEMADMLIADIRGHWSSSSPSEPGQAPARDTRNLDSEGTYSKRHRKGSAWAKGGDGGVNFVYVTMDTSAKRGQQYAPALEEGTEHMQARPFILRAMNRVRGALLG